MSLVEQIIAAVECWAEQMRAHEAERCEEATSLARLEHGALEVGRKVANLTLGHAMARLGTG